MAAEGIFRPTSHGVYPASSITKYCASLRESAKMGEPTGEVVGLTEQRARLAHSKADLAQMQVSKLRGELVPIEQVFRTWTAVVVMVRARILAIPTKLAPRLLGKKHAGEVETIIRAEVYECLEDLAENVDVRKPRPGDGASNQEDEGVLRGPPPASDTNDRPVE